MYINPNDIPDNYHLKFQSGGEESSTWLGKRFLQMDSVIASLFSIHLDHSPFIDEINHKNADVAQNRQK